MWQISKYTVISLRIIAWTKVIINDPQGMLRKRLNAIALFNYQTCMPCRARVLRDRSYHRLVEAEQVTGWHPSSLQLLKKVQPFVQLRADVRDVFIPFQWLADCHSEHFVHSVLTFSELLEQSDEQLFSRVVCSNHCLFHLLEKDKSQSHILLRPRVHSVD